MEVRSTNTARAYVFLVMLVLLSSQIAPFRIAWEHKQDTARFTDSLAEPESSGLAQHEDNGPIIFCDCFNQSPIVNSSMWDMTTWANPTISWEDNEYLMLEAKMLAHAILTSKIQTAPAVIADFNISFSQGECYFGIGWSDARPAVGDEWTSDLRLSANGVFIDCWEGSLFLACFSEGQGAAIPLSSLDLTAFHNFRLSWCDSLVRLEIDGVLAGFLTTCIPVCDLPFVVTISGEESAAGISQLRLDYIRLLERVRPARPDDPEILLLWPESDSWVYQSDSIDLEVENSDGALRYRWDTANECTVERPWDVPVPDEDGIHTLTVWSSTAEGHNQSKSFSFTVFNQSLSAQAPITAFSPNIDGRVDHSEEAAATVVQIDYSLANRTRIDSVLFVAFFEDSLYVGVRTPVKDGKYTRVALQVDGDSDGVWADSLGNCSDLAVIADSPTCILECSGIFTPGGRELSPQEAPGTVMATALIGHLVSAEFRVPLDIISGNSTRGIGLRIVISHAGYDCAFPGLGDAGHEFLRVTGVLVPALSPTTIAAILLVASLAAIGTTYMVHRVRRRNTLPLTARLQDETAERVRTLVDSYSDITVSRLSKMTCITEDQVIHILRELEEAGLVEQGWTRSHLGETDSHRGIGSEK